MSPFSHTYNLLLKKIKLLYIYLQGPPHRRAVIFVDKSDVDIILGMLLFVRELLSREIKTHVLLKHMV